MVSDKLNSIEAITKKIKEISKKKQFIFRGENEDYGEITSSLYREQKENINDNEILNYLHFPSIQKEIIDNVKNKKLFPDSTSNLEILAKIQHYGGKTNLIDFSKNFLIALFFACDGNFKEDGRLICLDIEKYSSARDIKDEDFEKDLILEPYSENNRVVFQSSVFIYNQNGLIKQDDEQIKIITISKENKRNLLKELKKYHNIHTDSIYNDLQGLIANDNNYKTAQTYFYIGLSFQDKKSNKKAIENYGKALEINPNFAEAYNNRGNVKGYLGDKEGMIKDYDKAIEINPNFAMAYYNRGVAKDDLGKKEEAIKDYNKSLEINPNFAMAYYNRGFSKDELKRYKEAIKDYNKAIQINPNDAEAYNNRGNAKKALGKKEEAIKDYDKAIEINPNYANAYNNRGVAKSALGKKEEAIKDYDKVLEINPNLAEAYYNRGLAKADLKRYKEAIIDYDKAIETNPNDAQAYYNRGVAKDDLGKKEEAIKDYNKAIEINANFEQAYYNRETAKAALGKKEEAIKDYNKAIEINPNDAQAYKNRGVAKDDLGDKEEAIKDYDKAIEINPNYADAYYNRGLAKVDNPTLRETLVQYINLIKKLRHQNIYTNMNDELLELFGGNEENFQFFQNIKQIDMRQLAMNKTIIPAFEKMEKEFEGFGYNKDLGYLNQRYADLCWVKNEQLKEKNLKILFEFQKRNTNHLIGGFVYFDPNKKHDYNYTKLQENFRDRFKDIPVRKSGSWAAYFDYWYFMNWSENIDDLKNLIFGDSQRGSNFKDDLKSKIQNMLDIIEKTIKLK